jgi:8-oxo-dGTP diphosphatase
MLLTRRMEGAHLEGYWEFPGGKLEQGEGPEEALVRECHEECGIGVEVDDIVDVTFHSYPGKDVLLLFYDCRLVSGEVQHLGVAEHVWCTPAELDDHPLPPADQKVVGKLKRRSAGPAP